MRSKGIRIELDIEIVPQEIIDSEELDIEFSHHLGMFILWIHSDGYKPIQPEHMQYLAAAKSVHNLITKTDHLNLYIETTDDIGDYGIETESKKYKNIRFSELDTINLNNVIFKREIES